MQISNKSLLGVELQRNYNWDVVLPDIFSTRGGFNGASISPFIQSISFGQYTMDDVNPIRHGPLQVHSAGLLSVKAVSMEFLCPSNSVVLEYFEGWKSLIYDQDGLFYYPKKNYANTRAIVSFYDVSGFCTYRYSLINIFPKTFPSFTLNYDSQDLTKFTVEFSIDKLEPQVNPII